MTLSQSTLALATLNLAYCGIAPGLGLTYSRYAALQLVSLPTIHKQYSINQQSQHGPVIVRIVLFGPTIMSNQLFLRVLDFLFS